MRSMAVMVVAALLHCAVARAAEVELTVALPAGMQVKAAVAGSFSIKGEISGTLRQDMVVFHDLLPDTPYDIRLTLAEGTVLQGVDMSWYNEEPAKPGAEPLSDDDREQIRAVLQDIKSFTNRNDIIQLIGDHNRAVLLAQLVRDKEFHADKGGEIIWRIELWYFKNNYGGWEKISQVNKVLRRERFTNSEAFKAATQKLQWMPSLGGIIVSKAQGAKTVTVAPPDK